MKKTVLMRGDKPYLIRWTLFSCKLFSIKIHKALISDPDEPHDHPWNYLSFIIRGGYFENTTTIVDRYRYTPNNNFCIDKVERVKTCSNKWYGPGSILWRKGDQLHKLIIPHGKSCISLIFTFKKWRKWGYLNKSGNWEEFAHQ